MFVSSPSLDEPGLVTKPRVNAATQRSGFSNADDAWAQRDNHNGSYGGYSALRARAYMTSGYSGDGKFTLDTDYYSWAVEYSSFGTEYSLWHRPKSGLIPERYGVYKGTPGVDYLGGFGTGIGRPHQVLDWETISSIPEHVVNVSLTNNLRTRIEAEAKNKAKDVKFDGGESIAGIKQSVTMVATRVSQVVHAWQAVRRGNVASAASHLGLKGFRSAPGQARKTAAQLWLELQYGWLPLLSDIHSGVRLIQEGLARDDGILTVTRRGSVELLKYAGVDSVWESSKPSGEARAYCETKYRFKVDNPTLSYISQLQLENPLYILWVVLPFSFVVDWLVPIGPWLQSLTAQMGLTFHSGYTSVKTQGSWVVQTKRKTTPFTAYNIKIREEGSFGYRMRSIRLRRYKHTTWPFHLPWYRFPFSSIRRVANAAALLEQARRRP